MQELAACLRDPLVPRFSHRFFTGGGAVAALTAHQTSQPAATARNAGTPEAPEADAMQAPTVSRAVSLANKMQSHRNSLQAGKPQPAEQEPGTQKTESEGKKKKPRPAWQSGTSAAAARQQAEDRALQV